GRPTRDALGKLVRVRGVEGARRSESDQGRERTGSRHWPRHQPMIETEAISRNEVAAAGKSETLIDRIIERSARNRFLVFIFTIFGVAAGIYGLVHTPLDAIPDLSDVQVIVYTEWEGRSPDLVEDQITYPISSVFIAAPKVKFVRGESMFGKSFIYVIFEDGTDIYWA